MGKPITRATRIPASPALVRRSLVAAVTVSVLGCAAGTSAPADGGIAPHPPQPPQVAPQLPPQPPHVVPQLPPQPPQPPQPQPPQPPQPFDAGQDATPPADASNDG